jgi:outer membrane protein TolC
MSNLFFTQRRKGAKIKMSITRYLIVFLLIAFISSCKMGKEYQRPEVQLPVQFGATVSFADTSSIADIEWRAFFTDTTLQQLIEKGDVAQQYVKQSKWGHVPKLGLQVSGRYDFPSENSLPGLSTESFLGQRHIENYIAGVSFSWEADIWGKIRNQKEAARAEYMRNHEAAKAVQTRLIADIADGYFNLLMLDKQLEIAQENLLLSDTFVIATRLLRDAGSGHALSVQQAEAQRQATALLIPQLEQSIALQENALQILTGSLPGTINRNAVLNDIIISDTLSTGLPAAIVSRRPDVRSAELSLVALNARVGIAQANMYPAINITAGGGLESLAASNWFSFPNSLFGWAAGTLTQPLFNRRELKTGFEVAKLDRECK